MATGLTKNQIRTDVRAALSAIGTQEYQVKSQQICKFLKAMPLWSDLSVVHVFFPVIARREPDIRPFISYLMSKGITIVLPVVRNFSRAPASEPRLEHLAVSSMDDLIVNRWGISEPAHGKPQTLADIDVVVVPAVAADRKGNRLGNGFGYYDELLEDMDCPRVCPILNKAYVEHVPSEPHDVGMTYIVTESGTWDFSGT